jgi:hypothetical protein
VKELLARNQPRAPRRSPPVARRARVETQWAAPAARRATPHRASAGAAAARAGRLFRSTRRQASFHQRSSRRRLPSLGRHPRRSPAPPAGGAGLSIGFTMNPPEERPARTQP